MRKSRDGAESHLSFSILESWRGAKAEKQLQQLAPSYQATYAFDDDQYCSIASKASLQVGR